MGRTMHFMACVGMVLSLTALTRGDACSDVLQQGIRDAYKEFKNTNYKTAFKDALCASNSQRSGSTNSGKAGATIPLAEAIVGVSGQMEQQNVEEIRQRYCRDSSSTLSDDDLHYLETHVANQGVVTAWQNCMHEKFQAEGEGGGLVSQIETNGDDPTFIFKVKWIPRFDVNQAELETLSVAGATCEPLRLKPGRLIKTQWITQQCTRDKRAVTITAEAAHEMGSTTQRLPAIPTPTPTPIPTPTIVTKMTGHEEFVVIFSSSFPPECNLGSIAGGSTFKMTYDRNNISWSAAGLFGGVQRTEIWGWLNSPNRTGAPYPPEKHTLIIGGGGFRFDDKGRVFRSCGDTEPQVGRLVFSQSD